MTNKVVSDITMIDSGTEMRNAEAKQALAERVAKRLRSGANTQKAALITVGGRSMTLDRDLLEAGLRRTGIEIVEPANSEHADIALVMVGETSELPAALESARGFDKVVLLNEVGAGLDMKPWIEISKQATKSFAGSGLIRDLSFTGLDGVAMMSLFSTEGSQSNQLEAAMGRIAELEFSLSTAKVSNTQVDDPDLLVAQRDAVIADLEDRVADAMQRANVAQDQLVGAYAEKARADGMAAEYQYLADIKDQESKALIEELEDDAMVDMRLNQNAGGDKKTFKQKLRSSPVGPFLATATRKVRK